jgi:hypothetical protein
MCAAPICFILIVVQEGKSFNDDASTYERFDSRQADR